MKIPSYEIIGDTNKYKGCLICTCSNKKSAENTLNRMLNNPTQNDKRLMEGHMNLRIKEVPAEKCWWGNV